MFFLTISIVNISILTLYRYSKKVTRENKPIKRVLIYEKILGLTLRFSTTWCVFRVQGERENDNEWDRLPYTSA